MATKKKKKREGRVTVYNRITSQEKLDKVNPENIQLGNDFLEYLSSIDRSQGTISQYGSILKVFWCWNLEFNRDKFFVDLTKRDIIKFQNHALNVWGWSPKRLRTVKYTLSSLSNYIENILDDEFEGFRPIVKKIESPANVAVRKKSIFTEAQLQKVLDHLVEEGKYKQACALSLAMNNGRRKAELTRFKVSYFDKKNLICDGALYKTPEQVKTKGRGKHGKMLDLYTLAAPFQPYLDMWLEERERLGIKSDWLFPSPVQKGEHVDESAFNSWGHLYEKWLREPFYWHSLRHYFTTKLSESNIPDSVIQDIIGWDSADMVKLYTDTSSEAQFEKYFGSDGIKSVKSASFNEI